MGLINILKDVVGGASSAFNSTLNTTMWREYFESGDMSDGVLMKRGEKILGKDSKNRKGDDNVITSGAFIDVQENQCMILVENGKIVDANVGGHLRKLVKSAFVQDADKKVENTKKESFVKKIVKKSHKPLRDKNGRFRAK